MGVGPHVQETADHVERVVRVNGGEDEMAGQGRLHRNGGRLRVPDFAHHDGVRVVPQDGAQAPRERQALLLVHRNLGDPRDLVLDGILHGHDLLLRSRDLGEGRVEGRRLSASGGTGGEQHPEGPARVLAEKIQLPAREPERLEGQRLEARSQAAFVEHPDHHVFAVHAGHDGNAEIHRPRGALAPSGKHGPEPSVLRDAPLGDVELRHHLEPRHDGLVVGAVHGLHRRIEDAVHPVLQHDLPGLGLDVDVGGAPLDGVQEQRIHEPDHGAPGPGVFERVERDDGRAGVPVASSEPLDPQVLGRAVEQEAGVGVPLDNGVDLRRIAHVDNHGSPEQQLQPIHLGLDDRRRYDDGEALAVFRQRNEAVAPHQLHGDAAPDCGVVPVSREFRRGIERGRGPGRSLRPAATQPIPRIGNPPAGQTAKAYRFGKTRRNRNPWRSPRRDPESTTAADPREGRLVAAVGLEGARDLAADHVAGRDLDGLSRTDVPAHPRFPVGNGELGDARKHEIVAVP